MSFLTPIADGTLSSIPRSYSGGTLSATPPNETPAESPESSAIAELSSLISSLGSLSAQAQNLPLTPPSLPGLPQNGGYQTQPTDYMQFVDDQN